MTPMLCDADGPRPMTAEEAAAFQESAALAAPAPNAGLSLAGLIANFTPAEASMALSQPEVMQAVLSKLAEAAGSQVNPQSERLRDLLLALGLSEARIAELLQPPVA